MCFPTHWVSIILNSIPLPIFYETQPFHNPPPPPHTKTNIKIVSQKEIPEYKNIKGQFLALNVFLYNLYHKPV